MDGVKVVRRAAQNPGPVPDLEAPGVRAALIDLRAVLDRLQAADDHRRHFLATYVRTTEAVGAQIHRAGFEDPVWVDRWDGAFAQLYLDALAAFERDPACAARPWRAALGADPSTPPLQLVLLGMNAHINYDLPQALLAVIDDAQFHDAVLLTRRRRDHERIDDVLAARVAAEDVELRAAARDGGMPRPTAWDRVKTPVNRWATKRFLPESRRKVWHNATVLQAARQRGPAAYRTVLAELELLTAARVNDLLAPGNVLLRVAAAGFGVTLPPA
jgi:hypothetical protein